MSYFTANQILDRVKEGKCYPLHIINRALELTGDIDEENNQPKDEND
ncbi:hypothetical protein UFOVP626_47 [uncultured Caudovirales phage]|uniref:Uncharacterized protein n=1 Tax=uncultured Caudovirales phage TaxID=2100421 RepID=A0A6J5PVP1_9CAUD|nr:hypothetical protein UFOVP626_47 [uncultured Caudovirales phage]CAB4173275.1 hypothetical protein UFOVP951_42 [uncultured Caudovirales phage]CAB4184897.1 hypothetical protein UFOVP1115_49 [uncultured Caudovirales phage]CAB4204320.1 hypothetical protein UFOVP1390_53 [uncultured Caudovirales phage]CAB5238471.1 hypothetical protein UFOVP1567_48 [uncultured Caudovirales phage]